MRGLVSPLHRCHSWPWNVHSFNGRRCVYSCMYSCLSLWAGVCVVHVREKNNYHTPVHKMRSSSRHPLPCVRIRPAQLSWPWWLNWWSVCLVCRMLQVGILPETTNFFSWEKGLVFRHSCYLVLLTDEITCSSMTLHCLVVMLTASIWPLQWYNKRKHLVVCRTNTHM